MDMFAIPEEGSDGFRKAFEHANAWSQRHRWQVGLGEMAIGASLIALGVQNGAIEMGSQLVASVFDHATTAGALGAAAGGALGTIPGLLLKSIGVAALGTAFSVPAIALMGGGALFLGLAGYGTGRLISDFLHPVPGMADFIGTGSLLLVGVALMVDGARRVATDASVLAAAARFTDGVLYLGRQAAGQVLSTKEALVGYLDSEIGGFLRDVAKNPTLLGTTTLLVAGGVGIGSSVAAASVTVLGSKTLGGVALALGIASAPVWPVVAGGSLALGAVYGLWRYRKKIHQPAAMKPKVIVLPKMEALRLSHDSKRAADPT